MNSFSGRIAAIQVSGNLSLVTVELANGVMLKAIIIETPESASYLKVDHPIQALFKETEVVMGTDAQHAVSLQNRISGTVKNIEQGALISRVIVQTDLGEVVSIISSNAVQRLQLKVKSNVTAMIKLNEMMLSA